MEEEERHNDEMGGEKWRIGEKRSEGGKKERQLINPGMTKEKKWQEYELEGREVGGRKGGNREGKIVMTVRGKVGR